MGLRKKVTITLVIIALIQIACRHCMPSTSRKASLKHYLNDLKPIKNNPVPTPYSPSRVNKTPKQRFGKTFRNGRISQNSPPKKSLYKTYNFPENEYPLDNSPRDPFRLGRNFNDNNHVSTLQKARNLQNSAINDLKKEMKMKRKLLSNKQMNNDNSQLKTDMSSIKFTPNTDSMRLLDSETFPEVQYPLNTMETWGPNYWSYLQFPQEKQCNRFEQQSSNLKAKADMNKPITRLTKAKASKYLQSYDKLKEAHRRTSTENSKRSNAGQKGLNFTKTATCERVSEDFITEGLVSKVPSKPSLTKTLTLTTDIAQSLENTCPVTEYPYHPMPIPYKVIENNTEDTCPALELKNNTKGLQDLDTNVIAQTIQFIEEILLHDDATTAAPLSNFSRETEKEVYLSDFVLEDQANKDVPTTLIDSTKNCTVSSTEESSQEVPDEIPAGILQDEKPSLPAVTILENITATAEPLNVRMPLPFSEHMTNEEHSIVTNPGRTDVTPLLNSHSVPATTSIIIIPINNNDFGKSQSHMFETTSGSPIIVYLPSTQTSGIPSQNQIVSSSFDNSVPNNQLNNVISNMTPLQNDNPFSDDLVSELLNSISDSGSSLPMYESLPTNSKCYNNESSPSSMKDKLISDILIHKSLTDDAPPITKYCELKLSQHPTETANFDMNPDTLPQTPNFELFDFADSELTSMSHGPYNNALDNELPILAREINSAQQISNVHSKDLFYPKKIVASEYLHKNIFKGLLPEITNDVSSVALDKNFSSESETDNLPESIDELPPAPLIDTTVKQSLPKEAIILPIPPSEVLSVQLPENIDPKFTPIPGTTTDSPSPSLKNSSPVTTDETIKTELHKIRHILDKMLSSQIPTDIQTTPIDTILSPISDTDRLPLLENQSLLSIQTQTESVHLSAADKTPLSVPAPNLIIDRLPLKEYETVSPFPVDDETLTDVLSLPVDKLHVPNILLETDSPTQPKDETVSSTPVFENPTGNKTDNIDNLVIPQFDSRTKDTLKNDLFRNTDDNPSKMNLVLPSIYEISSEDLPITIGDLPIMVHQERKKNPKSEVSTHHLPMKMGVLQNFLSDIPVSDLPIMVHQERTKIPKSEISMNDLPMQAIEPQNPLPEVLVNYLPIMVYQEPTKYTKSEVSSAPLKPLPDVQVSDLLNPTEALSMPEGAVLPDVSSESHTAIISDHSDKVQQYFPPSTVHSSEEKPKHKVDCALSTNPHAFANEPFLSDDLPLSVNDAITEVLQTTTNTKDLPFVVKNLILPEDDTNPNILVIDIPRFINNGVQSTTLDNTCEKVSESTFFDIPRDNTSNNKIPTTSKLPITKALMEIVLSDIMKGGLSSSVAKLLPVTPSPLSPLSEPKQIPPEEENLLGNEISDIQTDNLPVPESIQGNFTFPVDETHSDNPIIDLPLQMRAMYLEKPDIMTDDEEGKSENLLFDNPSDDFPLPSDKIYLPIGKTSLSNKNTQSVSKLPITKAVLESVLSGVTSKDFSLPVPKALPVKSSSMIDNITLYNLNPPVSETTLEDYSQLEDVILPNIALSDHQTYNNLPFSAQSKGTLLSEVNEKLAEVSKLDIPTEMYFLNNRNYYISSPKAENLPKDTTSFLPLLNTRLPSSSKLIITKGLLENVLSDINTKEFSLAVAKSLPVKSLPKLDKTVYYVESPISDINEESHSLLIEEHSDHLTDFNSPFSGQSEGTLPSELGEKLLLLSENDILPNISLVDQATDNNLPSSEQSKDTLQLDVDETLLDVSNSNIISEMSSDGPMDKILSDSNDVISSSMTETLRFPTDKPSGLFLTNNKTPSPLKLKTTNAILESVLSDINTKGFSLPETKPLPVESLPKLEETCLYIESPISNINEESPSLLIEEPSDHLTDYNTSFSGQSEGSLPLEVDEKLAEVSSLDISTEMSTLPKSNDDISSPRTETLPLPKDTPKYFPSPNTKTPSSSKLRIAKAVLENVLSDIKTKGFSLPENKPLPVESLPKLEETCFYIESPISNINEESPSLLIEEPSDHLTDYNTPFSVQSEGSLPLEVDEKLAEVSSLDISTEMSTLPKSNDDISSPITETLPLPKDTPKYFPSPNTKTLSSSKLRIAKTVLENVLSDIKTNGFSLPETKPLLVESLPKLEETCYYTESPISNINEESPSLLIEEPSDHLTDHNTPFSGQSEGTLPSEVDEKLAEVSSLDISTEMSTLPKSNDDISSPITETLPLPKDTPNYFPSPNTKTPSSSKLRIAKALLENVLSDIKTKGFSLTEANSLPVESHPISDKTLYLLESALSDINEESPSFTGDAILPNAALPDYPTDNSLLLVPFSDQSGDACPLDLEEKLSEVSILETPTEISSLMEKALPNSNEDILSPMAKILSPSKDTPSTSKLKISKAVLENVFSDISTKGFSVPVATSLPVGSRSQLDKSLYFMDPPLSGLNEESALPDILTELKNEDITELPVENFYPEYPDLDMDTDELPIEKMSELSEEEYEEFYETYSDNPIDYTDDLSTQMDELSLSDNLSHNLPLLRQNKPSFLITKAILEQVLSDLADGGIHP